MTLEECLNKKEVLKEFSEMGTTYKKEKKTLKIGDKFNRLTIIKLVQIQESNRKTKAFIAKCDCGNYVGPTRISGLFNGDSQSCGCLQREIHSKQMKERNYKHGCATRDNREHLYVLWGAMVDRATNINRKDAQWYVVKGISICEDWKDYIKFKDWAMANGYIEGNNLSIDRIDNALGYCPENCHWVPVKEQNRNKTSNRIIEYNGESMILADWCRKLNLNSKLVSSRLSRGWSELEALELIDR